MVKNILLYAPRLIYGGGEKVINWLAHQLYENDFNVFFATSCYDVDYQKKLELVGLKNKVTVVEFPAKLKYSRPFAYFRCVSSVLRDNNIDLLVYFGGSLIEQFAAKFVGAKVMLSERWSPKSRPLMSQLLKQVQYRFADAYVFQTPEAAKCYCKHAQKLGVIIPNPILESLPDPIVDNFRKEIVTVGRLSWEKNQILLLKAFSEICDEFPDYQLLIYGSGPKENELRAFVDEYKLNDRVQIIKGKRNIAELINGADLFVLPSDVEGMPNALIEAMAMGIPSISTDCPVYGPRMLIENNKNAYIVPLNDYKKMASVMRYSLSHPDNACLIRSEAVKIRERLNPNYIATQWISYMKTI